MRVLKAFATRHRDAAWTPTPTERPRYPLGQRVRVVRRFPKRGHIRTPFYLRGKNGCIDSILGWFLNPERSLTAKAAVLR